MRFFTPELYVKFNSPDDVEANRADEDWEAAIREYDEVDVASIGLRTFLHRVLLSDGTVIEIPFVSVMIHSFPLQEGRQTDASRQIA